MNIAHITDLANDSGGVLYVIAVMLFVALMTGVSTLRLLGILP